AEGLDPHTPALAIARATRLDQLVVTATIANLPERVAQTNLAGPVLVMIGRALGEKTAAREPMRGHGCRRRCVSGRYSGWTQQSGSASRCRLVVAAARAVPALLASKFPGQECLSLSSA